MVIPKYNREIQVDTVKNQVLSPAGLSECEGYTTSEFVIPSKCIAQLVI
jgi:hypothetical protein